MVAARWCQQRMWALESAAIDDELDAQRGEVDRTYSAITPDVRTALAFARRDCGFRFKVKRIPGRT